MTQRDGFKREYFKCLTDYLQVPPPLEGVGEQRLHLRTLKQPILLRLLVGPFDGSP